MIEINNIHLNIAVGTAMQRSILNGVNLKVHAGDFVTVIGTNGAGKSTLLDVISGERDITKGSIKIDNQDVTKLLSYERSHWIARVFQDPLLGSCGDLTVMENMLLAKQRGKKRDLRSAASKELRNEFHDILLRLNLGLENRLDAMMSELSGGQRQAVSLIMATLSPMQILLLDEHTSALDPKTGKQIMDITAQIVDDKKLTALMVTHNLNNALKYGNRTVILDEGKIAREFSAQERRELTAADLMELLN